MAFSNYMKTSDTQELIPVEVSQELLKNVVEESVLLKAAKRFNQNSPILEVPVVNSNGTGAGYVAEGGLISVTKPELSNVKLEAKKIAGIVVLTKEQAKDIANSVAIATDSLAQQIASQIDNYFIYGKTGNPFATSIKNVVASQTVNVGTDFSTSISALLGKVEQNGFANVDSIILPVSAKESIRNLVNSSSFQGAIDVNKAFGSTIYYDPKFDSSIGKAIAGDFSKALVGLYQDVSFEIETTGVVQSGSDTINLFQNDLVAVKAVLRISANLASNKAFAKLVQE